MYPAWHPSGRYLAFRSDRKDGTEPTRGGNPDIWVFDSQTKESYRYVQHPAEEAYSAWSPDGRYFYFSSNRSGEFNVYVMPVSGGAAERISFGQGRYSTPVWSPRGDLVAFTKSLSGRFHIGVMRLDGSNERILTSSYLDEGPTWSPNGRVIMFTREEAGGDPTLMSVDITGRNLRRVRSPGPASDPSWSPLLP